MPSQCMSDASAFSFNRSSTWPLRNSLYLVKAGNCAQHSISLSHIWICITVCSIHLEPPHQSSSKKNNGFEKNITKQRQAWTFALGLLAAVPAFRPPSTQHGKSDPWRKDCRMGRMGDATQGEWKPPFAAFQ